MPSYEYPTILPLLFAVTNHIEPFHANVLRTAVGAYPIADISHDNQFIPSLEYAITGVGVAFMPAANHILPFVATE